MKDLELIRLPIALVLIYFVMRLVLGFAGVSYETGNNIFAMVPLTANLCFIWGALSKARWGKGAGGAALVGLQIALVAQILIFGATLLSDLSGIDTYFNNPMAVNRQTEPLTLGGAVVARAIGLVINCVIGAVAALFGSVFSGLVPRKP